MATAMNAIGYDAAALGNHEFNYGLDTLRAFENAAATSRCSRPTRSTGTPARRSSRRTSSRPSRCPASKPITVGILGLVTPGVAIWDKANVEGKVKFPGIVEQAKVMVPRLKAAGADVVIVSCHSGADTSSSYGDALPYPENASRAARRAGARHRRDPRRPRPHRDPAAQRHEHADRQAGAALRAALLGHAGHASWTSTSCRRSAGSGRSSHSRGDAAQLQHRRPRTPTVAGAGRAPPHEKVLAYVNSVIGTCTQAMSAATSRYEDTAAIDFINYVQADAVKAALAGTPEAVAAGAVDRRAVQQGSPRSRPAT